MVRAILIWLLLMAAETAQGAARRLLSDPAVEFGMRQVGVVLGVVVIGAVTALTFQWMRIRDARAAWAVGALWAALTAVFEVGLGFALGAGWERIWSDYDLAHGGLMGLGLAAMAVTPWVVFRMRQPPRERQAPTPNPPAPLTAQWPSPNARLLDPPGTNKAVEGSHDREDAAAPANPAVDRAKPS